MGANSKLMWGTCLMEKFTTDLLEKFNFYLFLERGEGKEKERKRNIDWLPLLYASPGEQICNLGMCPDQN